MEGQGDGLEGVPKEGPESPSVLRAKANGLSEKPGHPSPGTTRHWEETHCPGTHAHKAITVFPTSSGYTPCTRVKTMRFLFPPGTRSLRATREARSPPGASVSLAV